MSQNNCSALVLRKTEDRESIRRLCIESGLEDGEFSSTVASFAYYKGSTIVGCASLKLEGDRYSVEWFAVASPYRNRGLGTNLIQKVEEEARRRGAAKLWALARAPGFFGTVGFRAPHKDEPGAPTTDGCKSCHQFRNTCFPEVLAKDL